MIEVKPFLYALSFLTRIPVPPALTASHTAAGEDWQKSVAYYPIVGAVIGLLLWGAAQIIDFVFPTLLGSVFLIVIWVFLTGGLHMDGWMDVADGLGSNRSREEMLRIMKDSRSGAMGVTAAILLLFVKTAGVHDLLLAKHGAWLVLPPVLARFVLSAAIRYWPYVSENGIGSGLRNGINSGHLLAYLLVLAAAAFWWKSAAGLAVLALLLFLSWILARYLNRKLGGLNGDCYGALVEWTEAVTLVLLVLLAAWGQ